MEEIKRYTIEACRDYSDCWIDVSEAIEQDYLTEELYCKDADVQGLEKQISDHKAVVETMKQDHENKIYHKDTEVNLAHGECEQLRLKVSEMQNKIDELKKQVIDTEEALTGAIDCINSMKCCGNCGNPNRSKRYCLNCTRLYVFKESGQKDLWIAKGD